MQGELGTRHPLCPATVLLPENEDVLLTTSQQNQFHVEQRPSECTVHVLPFLLPCTRPPGTVQPACLCSQPVPTSSVPAGNGALREVVSAGEATPTGTPPFVTRAVRCRHHWPPATFPQCPLCEASPADSLSRARCSSSCISAHLSGPSLCPCLRDDGAPALPGGLVSRPCRVPAPRHVPGWNPPPALAPPQSGCSASGHRSAGLLGTGSTALLSSPQPPRGILALGLLLPQQGCLPATDTQLGSCGGSPGGLGWTEGLAT